MRTPTGSLSGFLGSEARARLLAHFVAHPTSELHVRALQRHTGLGKRSLQSELERLEAMDLVQRRPCRRRVHYTRNPTNPLWQALEALVRTYAPDMVLRDVLEEVPGIEAAFVFGSVARGDARPDSDIDLLVYGDHIPDQQLGAALLDAALVLDRRVDLKRYDTPRFRRDARPGASFLPTALSGPKRWLFGSVEHLPLPIPKTAA